MVKEAKLCSCGNPLSSNRHKICDECKTKIAEQKIKEKKERENQRKKELAKRRAIKNRLHREKMLTNKIERDRETAESKWVRNRFMIIPFVSLLWILSVIFKARKHRIGTTFRNTAIEMPEQHIKYRFVKYNTMSKSLLTLDHINSMSGLIRSLMDNYVKEKLFIPNNLFEFIYQYNIKLEIPKNVNVSAEYRNKQSEDITWEDVWEFHGPLMDEHGNTLSYEQTKNILFNHIIVK